MIATVHTGTLMGITTCGVCVEVSAVRGLPGLDIVGLPEAAVRESRVRVLAALHNSGFALPERRYAVNLTPADVRKGGAAFDLAVAVALLASCELCRSDLLPETLVLGALSLDGRLLRTRGVLPHLRGARSRQLKRAIVPEQDLASAALVERLDVRGAAHLVDVVRFLNHLGSLRAPTAAPDAALPGTIAKTALPGRVVPATNAPYTALNANKKTPDIDSTGAPHSQPQLLAVQADADSPTLPSASVQATDLDLQQVLGQETAKRALEIACAGGHNLLLFGPPGAGKSMLAARVPALLPPPGNDERLEIATIASAADIPEPRGRPFRAPHHSCTEAALVGGGQPVRPGEVTLAHGGVLFLDELPEFRRQALAALRPTMELGRVELVRARQRVSLPANPLVVAAMNPCPCGYEGDPRRVCYCTPTQVHRYRSRISGPLMDRFDLHVQLRRVSLLELRRQPPGESTAVVRARVIAAQHFARKRAGRAAADHHIQTSATHSTGPKPSAKDKPNIEPKALALLQQCIDQLGLSLRAHNKVLGIARTIADLSQAPQISRAHVAEAVQYRVLDRPPAAAYPAPTTDRCQSD